jgi:cobalt-zinc-cadmium efflux system outer membrane protein
MRLPLPTATVLAVLAAASARAAPSAPATPFDGDPLLARLVEESLAARPELRQLEASARAERERVPQAGALPDPVLSLGIQNDGFDAIRIGEMETSFWQVMLTQPLPWPGKRGLRTDVARLSADEAQAGVQRARLATEGDVRRAYLDLLVARDRLALLGRLQGIWQQSSAIARARYEAGEGPQSDVLRAQLELNRLRQRRLGIEAQERDSVQVLNRLRGRPLAEAIATRATVRDLGVPPVPTLDAAVTDALARSPELAQTRLGRSRADAEAALARRERYPDLAVNAGVMPRGSLDPMWQAGISIGLPLWSSRKQGRAVAEREARADAGARANETVEQLVALRAAERRSALEAIAGALEIYRGGLLVQSEATAQSTLTQYRVGKVTFASVLEANAGHVADEDAYLLAMADAQRLAIASAEVALEPVSAGGWGALGGGALPGGGAAGRATGSAPARAGAGGAAAAPAAMPSGM